MLFSVLGCDEENDCCIIAETDQFSGTWLLYEYGYSPGAGYITESVPEKPRQTITFDNGKISSTMEGFKDNKRYEILTDSITNTPYIAFYKSDSDTKPATYAFDFTEDVLKLYFRWCIEGCHMAFKQTNK